MNIDSNYGDREDQNTNAEEDNTVSIPTSKTGFKPKKTFLEELKKHFKEER